MSSTDATYSSIYADCASCHQLAPVAVCYCDAEFCTTCAPAHLALCAYAKARRFRSWQPEKKYIT